MGAAATIYFKRRKRQRELAITLGEAENIDQLMEILVRLSSEGAINYDQIFPLLAHYGVNLYTGSDGIDYDSLYQEFYSLLTTMEGKLELELLAIF